MSESLIFELLTLCCLCDSCVTNCLNLKNYYENMGKIWGLSPYTASAVPCKQTGVAWLMRVKEGLYYIGIK